MTDKPSETPKMSDERLDELERKCIEQIIEMQGIHRQQLKPLIDHLLSIRALRPQPNLTYLHQYDTLVAGDDTLRQENEKLREEVKQLKEFRDGKAGPLIL